MFREFMNDCVSLQARFAQLGHDARANLLRHALRDGLPENALIFRAVQALRSASEFMDWTEPDMKARVFELIAEGEGLLRERGVEIPKEGQRNERG